MALRAHRWSSGARSRRVVAAEVVAIAPEARAIRLGDSLLRLKVDAIASKRVAIPSKGIAIVPQGIALALELPSNRREVPTEPERLVPRRIPDFGQVRTPSPARFPTSDCRIEVRPQAG